MDHARFFLPYAHRICQKHILTLDAPFPYLTRQSLLLPGLPSNSFFHSISQWKHRLSHPVFVHNEHLLMERIFVEPCGSGQIACPLLPVFCHLPCGIFRQSRNHLIFCYHKHSSKTAEGISPAALFIKTMFLNAFF